MAYPARPNERAFRVPMTASATGSDTATATDPAADTVSAAASELVTAPGMATCGWSVLRGHHLRKPVARFLVPVCRLDQSMTSDHAV